jgi:hypothetical protein
VVSKLQYQELRLNVIEEKLNITPPDRELTPHEQSVLDNIEPMDDESDFLHLVNLPRKEILLLILMYRSLPLHPYFLTSTLSSQISIYYPNPLLLFFLLKNLMIFINLSLPLFRLT